MTASLDGTDCSIWKTGKYWFSQNFKKPRVSYEIGVGILSGEICSINRSFAYVVILILISSDFH